jgi:hypothetical protein
MAIRPVRNETGEFQRRHFTFDELDDAGWAVKVPSMRVSHGHSLRVGIVALVVTGGAFACTGASKSSGFDPSGKDNSSGSGSSGGAPSLGNDAGGSPSSQGCVPDPKNAEIAGNSCDDDADGQVDNVATCDNGLSVDGDATAFAKALSICDQASSRGFGLVSASYSNGFGRTSAPAAAQWGILPRFGSVIVPREGASLGVLSSGFAREFDDDGGGNQAFINILPRDGMGYPTGAAPSGFPKPASGCKNDTKVNDMIDLKLTLQAPPNATGFKFDFDFYSSEWPGYLCSRFNDSFIAYLSAKGFNNGAADNISFDSKKDPVSVNNGFFDRCTSNTPTACCSSNSPFGCNDPTTTAACPGGPGELGGTGFGLTGNQYTFPVCQDGQTLGGATGWLTTQAPVTPGETFTLEFMIWDTGDGVLDSSVLLDNFEWIGGSVSTGTGRPPK